MPANEVADPTAAACAVHGLFMLGLEIPGLRGPLRTPPSGRGSRRPGGIARTWLMYARGALGGQTMNDPIVDEVRKVRDAHASRFNYDLDAIFRDIKEQEKKSGRAFVSFPPPKAELSQALHPTRAAISAADGASTLEDAPTA